jgi:glycosyltransferase involved in cell wall biosynthesis
VKTIGLCMIVKNEAQVILRCLDSVRPFLDYVLIEDTGSTDGTQELIRGWLNRVGLPGVVIEEPWRDFSYNRSHALAKLREHSEIDYAFMIDADDRIDIDDRFDVGAFKAGMSADFYDVEIYHGSVRHHRPQIYRNSIDFTYRGVLHEFLQPPREGLTRVTPTGFHMTIVGGGGRSQDKEKFQRDAAVLEGALATEQDSFLISRYTFYLAQSYRDYGAKEKALERYLAREAMGFWDDEIYVSLCEAAHISADLGRPEDEVLAIYERAIAKVPYRAEAFHGASHYCFQHGRNEEGYQIAKRGLKLTESPPPTGLFIQSGIYETGLLDKYALNAYWSGHYKDCLDANLRILSHPSCPGWQRKRFLDNAKFAASNLSDELTSSPATEKLRHGPRSAVPVAGQPYAPDSPARKTLIFCTAFARTLEIWNSRYRKWINGIQGSSLEFDQIMMVDDGSPVLPDWNDLTILSAESDVESNGKLILVHFPDNLGRRPGHNYPGWYRSYAFAAEYAKHRGFDKVIHIESDSFVIGNAIAALFNNVENSWIALWDSFWEMPETAVQVAAGKGIDDYFLATRPPYSEYADKVIERVLPFTQIIKNLKGGKYPEYLNYVPSWSDYVTQATEAYPSDYFWWLKPRFGLRGLERKSVHLELDGIVTEEIQEPQRRQVDRIFTYRGTVVYIDEETWELRHGPVEQSPANTWLMHDLKHGTIEFVTKEDCRSVIFAGRRSFALRNAEMERIGAPLFVFNVVTFEDGRVGLKSGVRFICAEADGTVGLFRYECGAWERFRLLRSEGEEGQISPVSR